VTHRILHYNWAQFDDPEFRGGGVSVYLRNLLTRMAGDPEFELVVLSAGHHYTFSDRKPRYEETANTLGDQGVKSFRILNSPVKAPAHDMFYDIGTWRSNREIAELFAKVLTDQGPFDTVVLHSMEGISSEVLALKDRFPHTRFVYMWHNYMPVCSQIELLHQSRDDCRDYEGGLKCAGCLAGHHSAEQLITPQRLGSSLEFARLSGRPLGNFLFGLGIGSAKIGQAAHYFSKDMAHNLKGAFAKGDGRPTGRGFEAIDAEGHVPAPPAMTLDQAAKVAGDYRAWRELNLKLLNRFDAHMVVSQLVADTIIGIGVDPALVQVTPLGMDIHASPAVMRERAERKPRKDGRVRLSFIGYGIPSKGLPFITRALMAANHPLLRERAELTVYARLGPLEINRLLPLRDRFAEVKVVPGYNRSQLGAIARDIDLNIVPSIWRETYNQVGFELLCLGTPSLLSSTVGLGMFYRDQPDFIFEANEEDDFMAKLVRIVENPGLLEQFWRMPPELPSMDGHIAMTLPAMTGIKKEYAA